MQAFVDAFNDVRALTEKLTEYEPDEKQGSLLTGDSAVRSIRAQLQRILLASVSGVGSGSVRSLVDVGVTSDQNNQYYLTLDESKLNAALAKDPAGVQGLLASQSTPATAWLKFAGFGSKTEAGSYRGQRHAARHARQHCRRVDGRRRISRPSPSATRNDESDASRSTASRRARSR